MKIETLFKVLLFKYILPEYVFMPWQTIITPIIGKDCLTFEKILHGPPNRRIICFFKVKIDGIYDEPEVSKEFWEKLHEGNEIRVHYRKSRIHDDTHGGRELQSIICTKYIKILVGEEKGD